MGDFMPFRKSCFCLLADFYEAEKGQREVGGSRWKNH